MTLHPVIIYYDEDTQQFEYDEWQEEYHHNQSWAINALVWLNDEEYTIITGWIKAQALMEQKCRGYKPKKPEGKEE